MVILVPLRLDKRVAEHGAGSHTFVVMTNGMHVRCQERVWFALNASYESNMAGASLARDRFTVVYKDLDATHFPTPSGAYVVNANRSLWDCAAVNSSDPPQPQRRPTLRGLWLPNGDWRSMAGAANSSVASKAGPHWMTRHWSR